MKNNRNSSKMQFNGVKLHSYTCTIDCKKTEIFYMVANGRCCHLKSASFTNDFYPYKSNVRNKRTLNDNNFSLQPYRIFLFVAMDSAGITVYSKCLEFQIASISIVVHCFENPIFHEKKNFQPAITREPVRILRNGQRHSFSHIKNYINRYQNQILKFCPPLPPKKNPNTPSQKIRL